MRALACSVSLGLICFIVQCATPPERIWLIDRDGAEVVFNKNWGGVYEDRTGYFLVVSGMNEGTPSIIDDELYLVAFLRYVRRGLTVKFLPEASWIGIAGQVLEPLPCDAVLEGRSDLTMSVTHAEVAADLGCEIRTPGGGPTSNRRLRMDSLMADRTDANTLLSMLPPRVLDRCERARGWRNDLAK